MVAGSISADQLNLGHNVCLKPFAIGGQCWNGEALRQGEARPVRQ
jgi:hypothetical protein